MIRAAVSLLLAVGVAGGVRFAPPAGAERAEGAVTAQQGERHAKLVTEVSRDDLYVAGQPFLVTVEFTARRPLDGGRAAPAEVATRLLEPAAWELDGRPLARRGSDGTFQLQPGQTLRTELDLAPLIAERLEGERRDFRLRFVEGEAALRDVVFLGTPEAGIDFMELPASQLDDYQVVLDTDAGLVWLGLWPDVAPAHVRNFLDLVSTGFYDETRFHRTIPGFMIQGGKPREGVEAPRTVPAEFSDRPHVAGVLSAARRAGEADSATSEFFIIHRDSRHLDGQYSAFGEVLHGMGAVEEIVRSADVHEALVKKMLESGIQVEVGDPRFDFVVHDPNPPRRLRQALVVRATDSRPAPRGDDDGR